MTSRDFAFWLQGFFELSNQPHMTDAQVEMVKRHLALVFKHEIDPAMGSSEVQKLLDAVHHGTTDKLLDEKIPRLDGLPKGPNGLMRC